MNNMLKVVVSGTRKIHTSLACHNKMGKVMKKVMGHSSKKKRIVPEAPILPTPQMFSKGSHEGRHSGNARRVSVLNKLFMKHITDFLITGEYSSEFISYGIEINRVQVTPDFNGLNVFWVAKGTKDDDLIEKLLKKNAGFLRHELSSLRVVGNVPKIYFVKDKHYSQVAEVDSRLSVADFGEDHIPVETTTKLKTELELFTHLPAAVREKIEKLESDPASDDLVDEELPPMPQNVLGLNHADILKRIKRSMKKSEASHRITQNWAELPHTVNENPIEFKSDQEQRDAFKNFLEKRELLRSKARKLEKNYYPDLEYMKEEFEERRAEYFRNLENYNQIDELSDEDEVGEIDDYEKYK